MTFRGFLTVIFGGITVLAYCADPYIPITANFEKSEPSFEINGRVLNTPIVRATTMQGTNVFNPVGYNAYLSFGKDSSATGMVVTTGTCYSTYVDFRIASNTFARPVTRWYAAVMLTHPADAGTYSMAYGYLNVKAAPEVNANGVFNLTTAINGSEYGPFTGDFTNWPFALKGDFGGYIEAAMFNATNASFQGQITALSTGNVSVTTYDAHVTAQGNTNTGFQALFNAQANSNAGFQAFDDAQGNTNAGFQAMFDAQAASNTYFESMVGGSVTNQAASNELFQARYDAQANTNAGFQAMFNAQANTNIGFQNKFNSQANTNAGFQAMFNAQANTNIGFQNKFNSQDTSNAAFSVYLAKTMTNLVNEYGNTGKATFASGTLTITHGTNVGSSASLTNEALWNANSNYVMTGVSTGLVAYGWGDHASEGYLKSTTNRFEEIIVAPFNVLGTNICGMTGVYEGVVSTEGVGYTGTIALVKGSTYLAGFTKQNAFGTATLSMSNFSLSATVSGLASNYFGSTADTTNNIVITIYGDGASKSDVSNIYVKAMTNGDAYVGGNLYLRGVLYENGALVTGPQGPQGLPGSNVYMGTNTISGVCIGGAETNTVTFFQPFTNVPNVVMSWATNTINQMATLEIIDRSISNFHWVARGSSGLLTNDWSANWIANNGLFADTLVGATGATGAAGTNGVDGAAATIGIAWVSNSVVGSDAVVTNVGTASAASLGFIVPVVTGYVTLKAGSNISFRLDGGTTYIDYAP